MSVANITIIINFFYNILKKNHATIACGIMKSEHSFLTLTRQRKKIVELFHENDSDEIDVMLHELL
jgi:hypothetical protein